MSSSSSDDDIDLSDVIWDPSNIKTIKENKPSPKNINDDDDEIVYRKGFKLLDKIINKRIEIKDNVWKEEEKSLINVSESPTGIYLFSCSNSLLNIELENKDQIKDNKKEEEKVSHRLLIKQKAKKNYSSSSSDSDSDDDTLKFSESAVEFNFETKQFGLVNKFEPPKKKKKKNKKKK